MLLYWGKPIMYNIYPLWLLDLNSLAATQKTTSKAPYNTHGLSKACKVGFPPREDSLWLPLNPKP